mgnify:CR=1
MSLEKIKVAMRRTEKDQYSISSYVILQYWSRIVYVFGEDKSCHE